MSESLIHVSGPVWFFPTDGGDRVEPNIGVVDTSLGTVLIDAGNSPQHGRRVAAAVAEAGLAPVTHIIYTHSHWDHVFGAQVFDAPVVIAHTLCAETLTERAARPWSELYLEEESRRTPLWAPVYRKMQRAVGDWAHFQIVTPTVRFSHSMTLHLAETTLRVQHVGGQHSSDSLVVVVPEVQVAFVGDSYYGPVQPGAANTGPEREIVRRLLELSDVTCFVDGHKAVVKSREAIAAYADEPVT